MAGVILISHEAMPKESRKTDAAMRARSEYFIGIGACLGDVLLSGFASIYFEKVGSPRSRLTLPADNSLPLLTLFPADISLSLCSSHALPAEGARASLQAYDPTMSTSQRCMRQVLKSTTETFSVWDRNFQLAFWSSVMYAPIMFYDNPTDPFAGWTIVTLSCAAVGALGGVLVALCIKHADSIMKTIATTGAIVLTTVLNAAFMNGPYSLPIVAGGLVVVVSVFNYNDDS